MKHVAKDRIRILESDTLTKAACTDLLNFFRTYQQKDLEYFLKLRLDWIAANSGRQFPGIFAEVDSITGQVRAPEKQFCWSWGDNRALGIWTYFLLKDRITDTDVTISMASGKTVTVNLRKSYEEYCKHLYASLRKRYDDNNGHFPFMVDPVTNKAANDPKNIPLKEGEYEVGHVFAINAMFQYGIWQNDSTAIETGRKILRECFTAGTTGRFVFHKNPVGILTHGGIMVTLGAIVDVLKSLDIVEKQGRPGYAALRAELVAQGLNCVDFILDGYLEKKSGALREFNDLKGKPFINPNGHLIADPGHMTEAAGFFVEFCAYLNDATKSPAGRTRNDLIAVSQRICVWASAHGYSKQGLMFKNVDLLTLEGVADATLPDGRKCRTAPWWNVRELSAAAIRLFALTRDPLSLAAYRKANNACYLNYPNDNIGGLMVQTLDADTKEPLPLHPATGNLDPMHTGRSREREIEALEELMERGL